MKLNSPLPTGFIFDLDGTLIDSMHYHKRSWLQFLQQNGKPISEKEFEPKSHGTVEEAITRFFGDDLDEQRFLELCFEKEALYRSMYQPHLKEIQGVFAFLQELKNDNKKIALATMGNKLNIDFSLDGIGIRHFFDVICGGNDVKRGKPHPEIYELAVKRMQLSPKECIVFEDTSSGIAAATAAGMNVIGIATTHSHNELMRFGCMHAIDHYHELDWKKWFED